MSLRTATAGDAPAMAAAHRRSFASPWAADEFESLLGSPGVFGLVVETPPAVAGLLLARTVAGEAEILTVCIDPDARGQGLGGALIEAAMALAAQTGAKRMFLEVAEDNTAALAAYVRAGFRPAGRRPGYYPRPGGQAADALTLRADLNSRPA